MIKKSLDLNKILEDKTLCLADKTDISGKILQIYYKSKTFKNKSEEYLFIKFLNELKKDTEIKL